MNEERLYELLKCEVCKKNKSTENINIGLDIGYTIGDYSKKNPKFYKVKPKTVAICSIYVCNYCKNKLRNINYYKVNILKKIREEIKSDWIKQNILENLR